MEFTLPYMVSNGGDGSANVVFYPTYREALQADDNQPMGWGESSADKLRLKVEDGKLFYWAYVGGRPAFAWVEVTEP